MEQYNWMKKTNSEVENNALKKQFSNMVEQLDKQFKSNNLLYRQKYFHLVRTIQSMHQEAKVCYRQLLKHREELFESSDSSIDGLDGSIEFSDPSLLIEYSIELYRFASEYINKVEERMKQSKLQVLDLFKMEKSHNYLQTLAQKNLQNFELKSEVEQLQSTVQMLKSELKIEREKSRQFADRIADFTDDYDLTLVSIAEILKKSEINQIELRQENRLHKEMLQSQKIQFERYKTDFKRKPTPEEKQSRIRQIFQKKYEAREMILAKQIERIVKKRLLGI